MLLLFDKNAWALCEKCLYYLKKNTYKKVLKMLLVIDTILYWKVLKMLLLFQKISIAKYCNACGDVKKCQLQSSNIRREYAQIN